MKAKLIIISILFLSGLLGLSLSLYLHRDTNAKLHVIQTYHYPAQLVQQLAGDPNAGEKIFKEFCAACHASPPIIDISAPRIGDKKAWEARRRMGIDVLLKLTV